MCFPHNPSCSIFPYKSLISLYILSLHYQAQYWFWPFAMSVESKNNSVQVGELRKFDLAVPLEIFSSALVETDSVVHW